jgi:hypothetical protein
MTGSDEIMVGVEDLVQRIGDSRIGYSVAGRSRGRVTSCAVCIVYVKTKSVSFLVESQNQGQWFVSGLASKPLGWFVSGLSLKPLEQFVSGFASKPLG